MERKEITTLLKKHGFEEEIAEVASIQSKINPTQSSYKPTGFPDPIKRYRLIVESPKLALEESYYWILSQLEFDHSFPYYDKIVDTFTASEQSAMWGAAQSRIGLQQDRVSQYLKGISEMIKQLFQLVRELRILDEKLEPRKNWGKTISADITLKGEYTDIVENRAGQVQPGSLYHLAQQVGYASLPDIYFNTHVYKIEDIDNVVDGLRFNNNVKHVLRRKLHTFINWKLKTDEELKNRRTFTIRYLRQHWNTIKMYMNWIKPYLRNISRMQMRDKHIDSVNIIGAFETSMIEIEVLAYKPPAKGEYNSCILIHFLMRTTPDLTFQQDSYQHKGPIHTGRLEFNMRGYMWTDEQIKNYKSFRKEEDMVLLSMVDDSIKAAMEALGGDLEKYLYESGEQEFIDLKQEQDAMNKNKAKIQSRSTDNIFDPFISIFKGIGEIANLFNPRAGIKKEKSYGSDKSKKGAGSLKAAMYLTYKNYKKAHKLVGW